MPIALITGAGKRLGRAIALRLAAEGCDVAVHYRSSRDEAESLQDEIRKLGRKTCAVGFDQTDVASIEAGLASARTSLGGPIEVLVNSASIFEWDDLATVERNGLQRHFEVNLFGPVLLTRHIAAAAGETAGGLIVNMLDQKLANPNPDHLSYTLSKYALQGFTQLMAQALAPRFRVCAIAPGLVLPGPGDDGAKFAAIHDQTPLGVGPTPEDIAEAAAYLLNAKAVTGQTIFVDGGSHLRAASRDFAFH